MILSFKSIFFIVFFCDWVFAQWWPGGRPESHGRFVTPQCLAKMYILVLVNEEKLHRERETETETDRHTDTQTERDRERGYIRE